VIGGDPCPAEALAAAETVGRELAKRGAAVVCGGRGGVMEAACRGARGEGGHTIGIMPGRSAEETPPNAYVEFPIYTGLAVARNAIVALSGEAVIAIAGGYGTLSEIAIALIHDIPVIGIDTWDFAYHGNESERIVRTSDPVEAAEMAVSLARSRHPTAEGDR